MSVENALATGVRSDARSCAMPRAASSLRPVRAVDRLGGEIADAARRAGQRLHGHQHALHVRMLDDRAHAVAGAAWRAALAPLLGVGERALIGPLGDRDALEADREAGVVHHREHAGEAAVLLADQKAGRAARVAIDHGAGRRGMDAELVLDGMAAHVVARAVGQQLRHEEERDAAGAGRRVGQARQHEVDDVVDQVVLAIGDEDLAAGDPVGAVGGPLGAAADGVEVGAGLRLGQVHGRGPFAGHDLGEIAVLQLIRAVLRQRLDAAHGQERRKAEGHAGRVPHLDAGRVEKRRQALAAIGLGTGQRVPAGRGPGAIRLLEAARHGDGAVLERQTLEIAAAVQRRELLIRELARLLEDRLDEIEREIAVQLLGDRAVEAGDVAHGEDHLGDRRAIAHGISGHLPSGPVIDARGRASLSRSGTWKGLGCKIV